MAIQNITCNSIEKLEEAIKKFPKILITSSKTGTVIPYGKIDKFIGPQDLALVDITSIAPSCCLENGNLRVNLTVNWKEAKSFVRSKGRDLKCFPTEELAMICAGVATSANGERSFCFGPFRDQILEIKYLNANGELKTLKKERPLKIEGLNEYQKDWKKFRNFKNAPFPRLEKEIDLMIGTEGQLGVVTEVLFETTSLKSTRTFLLKLPRWIDNYEPHLEVLMKIQKFKHMALTCEFLDWNSLKRIENLNFLDCDLIAIEVFNESFEDFINSFVLDITQVSENDIFEIENNKFEEMRVAIPRATADFISKNNLIKMGTDIQINPMEFKKLLNLYIEGVKLNTEFLLFGHFGDCHLHFNFLPKENEVNKCLDYLEHLYKEVSSLTSSPFAEHGIGMIKQKYIRRFLGENQIKVFKELKNTFDPTNKFFPYGFLSMDSE